MHLKRYDTMIYICVTLFSVAFVYVTSAVQQRTDIRSLSSIMIGNASFVIAFLIICIPGMIRYNVGIDYTTYSLEQIPGVLANEPVKVEFLFKWLIKLGYWISGGTSYQYIFAMTNFIIDIFIFKYIRDQSKDMPLSVLIFMFGGFFAFSLSGMRQSIGVAMMLYGIKYIYKRKIIPFVVLLIVASLFHTSAMIFLLFYFSKDIKINPMIVTAVMTGVFIFSRQIRQLIILVSTRIGLYSNYFGGTFDNGKYGRLFIVMVIIVMVFVCASYFILGKKKFYRLRVELNIHYMACMVIAMISQLPTPSRLYFLFVPVYITLIPNMIKQYNLIKTRSWLMFLTTLYFFVFGYWNIFVQDAYNILPYHSVFNKF